MDILEKLFHTKTLSSEPKYFPETDEPNRPVDEIKENIRSQGILERHDDISEACAESTKYIQGTDLLSENYNKSIVDKENTTKMHKTMVFSENKISCSLRKL